MTTEEREARLTAYALNDPGLTEADRQDVERELADNSQSRLALEEIRQLALILKQGLAAEQAAVPAETAMTIPSSQAPPRKGWRWTNTAIAASVLVLGALGVPPLIDTWKTDRAENTRTVAATTPSPHRVSLEDRLADKELKEIAGDGLKPLGEAVFEPAPQSRPVMPLTRAPQATTPVDESSGSKSPATVNELSKLRTEAMATERELAGQFQVESGSAAKGDVKADKLSGASPVAGPTPAPGLGGPGRAPENFRLMNPSTGGVPGGGGSGFGGGGPPGAGGFGGGGNLGRGANPVGFGDTAPGAVPDELRGNLRARISPEMPRQPAPNDKYRELIENPFTTVEGQAALSTFGVDVDTASYSIVRKYLGMHQLPPANAVRLEELVNYFPYADKAPENNDPFAVTVEMADCPWQPKHRLVRVGLKAKPIDLDKRPASNLVFLVDVSGSMNEPNKLPLVLASLKLLVNRLGENDRVALVVYAGASGMVLDSTSATQKAEITNALDRLQAGGSTNGGSGIQLAYNVAVANFIKGGTNRVILCTDGDWNVGTTGTESLVTMIEEKRKTGVFLSVLGFGMGNLRDEMMVQLAGKGNGNYFYIDDLKEANKALVEQLGGTLVTVAKDVKIQVEFNPAAVKSYRLLGYEKRALAAKDFHDDKKDAGEMGAGHVVTALYELVPVGEAVPNSPMVDGLRYQKPEPKVAAIAAGNPQEAFVVKMRHKKPDSDTSTLRELPVMNESKSYTKASEDFRFAASVASFAMLLRESEYRGNSSFASVIELADAAKTHDPGAYRAEFVEMVRKAKTLSGKP